MKTYRTSLTRFVFGLVCLSAIVISIPAQQKQDPVPEPQADEDVLRISTELVQTDVVVVDKQGHFVEGLKPEQFELKVDGKPQPISFFESVTAWTANEEKQLAAARGAVAAGTSAVKDAPIADPQAAVATRRGRTIIFFVDDMHLNAESVLRVRKLITRFIDKEMGEDDMVAIASPTGSIGFLQQFTNNKTVLRAAAARITYTPYSIGDTQHPSMSEFQAQSVDRNEPDVIEYYVAPLLQQNPRLSRQMAEAMVHQRAEQILKQSSLYTVRMLIALDGLMRTSLSIPGRKLAFFLSDGFYLYNRNSDALDRL
ncbi:MAG TPA: VWA domain-containing protein, partial [Pyrinomonadaceae bacterium]|nr:VWA domain-containing protein [Pyrinomonadaceae bacterium]